MSRLYLIRHAKSSWSDSALDDFDRPLNSRGKRDGPEMARRLGSLRILPDLIVSSPAKRAKKTAKFMAEGVGYNKKKIRYIDALYLGSLAFHLNLLESLTGQYKTLFLVGHNHTITELAEYLTAQYLGNIPTSGVVAIGNIQASSLAATPGGGDLLFFDYPKNSKWVGYE